MPLLWPRVITLNSVFVAPDATAAEPPDVAASAAEPSEEAGVHIYELFVCPDEVMETISESPIIPFSALETNHELSALSVAITNSVIMARKAACDLSICLATAKEVISELYICPVTAKEANLVIST